MAIQQTVKTTISIPSEKKKKWFYVGFIVINLFLSCYYLDIWITPNTASRAIPVMTLYDNHMLVIDNYVPFAVDVSKINDHFYSNKAPLTSFLVYPFYAAYKGLGLPELKDSTIKKYPIYIYENIKQNYDGRSQVLPKSATIFLIGDILCGAIPFVLILILSLFAIRKITTQISPVIIVMLTFYASFIFAYSGAYTSHILAGVFALISHILIKKKNYVFSGVILGLAVATEYPVGVLIPVWAILIYLNEKKLSKSLLFAAGLLPGLLLVFYYNYHLTGSIFKTSYSYETNQHKHTTNDVGFYFPTFSAFWGLVFSTYRGVLYYTPVLILMIWYGIKYGYQDLVKKVSNRMEIIKSATKSYLLVTVLAYLLLYCSYYEWSGGWAYGPRYLVPMVVIVLYEGVIFLSRKPFAVYVFYVVAGIGVLFTWLDKSTKIFEIPSNPANAGNPIFDIIIPDFFKHKFNTDTIPVFMFDSNPVLAIYAWPVLFMAGLIGLTLWYYKLYPARKSTMNLVVPVLPLLVLYISMIASQSFVGSNNLTLDTKGIYGAWKHFDLANNCMSAAQSSKTAVRKTQLYTVAISEYKKVIQLTPEYQDCYFGLGVCYAGLGYADSAISSYKKVLQLNPKFSMAAKNLGVVYLRKTEFDTAIKYFKMSYNADSNIGALINLGASYQQEGRFAMAMHYDSLVLKTDPNNKSMLHNLSMIHNNMGMQLVIKNELDEALNEFALAQKCDPDFANPIGNMGIVYQKKGDTEKAKYYYQKARSKDPGSEMMKVNRPM